MVSLSFHNYHQYSWIIIRIHLHICHHQPSIFVDLPTFPLICFRPGPVSVCPGEHVKHVKYVKPQSSCLVNGSKWKQDRNILHHFAKCLANVSRLRDNSALKSPGAKALFHQCTDPLTVLTAQIWRFGNSQIPLLWQIPSLSWFHHDSIMINASSHLFFHFWYNLMLQDLLYTWL